MSEQMILGIHHDGIETVACLLSGSSLVNRGRHVHKPSEFSLLETPEARLRLVQDTVYRLFDSMRTDPATLTGIASTAGEMGQRASGVFLPTAMTMERMRSWDFGDRDEHLSALAAFDMATRFEVPFYLSYPRSCDDYDVKTRLSGHPALVRSSGCNLTWIRYAVEKASRGRGREVNAVVAYMDAHSSVAALSKGRLVDSTWGGGPFSMASAGSLPLAEAISLVSERNFGPGGGGFNGYLGEKNFTRVEELESTGDDMAHAAMAAYLYQFRKAIYEMAGALAGEVDLIVLTGIAAASRSVDEGLRGTVSSLAPVEIVPGADCALASAWLAADAVARGTAVQL